MQVLRIPFSTNVERVALAAGHKGIPLEWVDIDESDRSAVGALSGQPLVPVLVADDGAVVVDSTTIIEWLDAQFPEKPLYPAQTARRAEVRVFIDWFNVVWKRPPNLIAAGQRVAEMSERMRRYVPVFEQLLDARDYLFGEFGAADCVAFPFLKYPVLGVRPGDDDPFHRVLVDHQPLREDSPLHAWVRRVDARPRS